MVITAVAVTTSLRDELGGYAVLAGAAIVVAAEIAVTGRIG